MDLIRNKRRLALLLALAAVLAAAVLFLFFFIPGPRPVLGEGDVVIGQEAGGLALSWPEAEGAERYLLTVRDADGGQVLAQGEYDTPEALLPGLSLDGPLEVELRAAAHGRNLLGMERRTLSRSSVRLTVEAQAPAAPQLDAQVDAEDKTLTLRWTGGGDYCEIVSGDFTLWAEAGAGEAQVVFGQDVDMPAYDAPAEVDVRLCAQGEGYRLCGPWAESVTVEKEQLLGNQLSLECLPGEDTRCYTLRWNETKGDYYELQEWSDAQAGWETLAQVDREGELRYETGRLNSGSSHLYRVVARHRDAAEDTIQVGAEFFAAQPGEVSFRADFSPLYCSVWPVIDVGFYEVAGAMESVDTVPAGTCLCVLGEEDGFFYVRFGEDYGYVDSGFCMIDLPEYLGDLCEYAIPNARQSVFRVHEYPIQGVTGQVIQGYENVGLADGTCLAPYLYPCAQKLMKAALAAEADGYRLRIYDAFRPNEATRYLYDTTSLVLDTAVPDLDEEGRPIEPITGWSIDLPTGLLIDPETEELVDPATVPAIQEAMAAQEAQEAAGTDQSETPGEPVLPPEEPSSGEIPADEAGLTDASDQEGEAALPPSDESQADDGTPAEETEPVLTYRQVMTDGRFGIGSFLAASVSAHNRGIALDLTLVDIAAGEELEMQAPIHDLSWYAAAYRNNDNAKLLEQYMTGVGMRGLTSEWWHFQDDETREAIGLTSYLTKGVSVEGWKKDDNGWRYRAADGSYYTSGTYRVGGESCTFDSEGYVK